LRLGFGLTEMRLVGEFTVTGGSGKLPILRGGFHFDEKWGACLALKAGLSLFPVNVRCSRTGLADDRRIDRTCPLP
jgi:hypothetical protein